MYKVKIVFSNGIASYYEGYMTYEDARSAAYNLFAENLYLGACDFKIIR